MYDEAGNLKEKTETTNGTVRGKTTYTYDAQNRLETVTEPDGGVTSYTYDGAGNRKTETTVKDGVETTNTYTYNGRNQLLTVEQTVGETVVSKTEYSYDANGNQLSETQTVYGAATESGEDETTTVLSNTYDLRNQLVRSETSDTVINNTYNAAGYRVEKSVTKDGKTEKTYFLYDGSNVIMEADASGEVTAKNTYGGPLLMRTVFGEEETTYEYMYNAHGDVVTLLTDGEVAATYYYDAFGNILDQTGEADNSILYAGYQYDEETGLYYVNARMYDPVTARFLQADTYLGNLNDPLSLNLYTYCLNNPQKYVDPSGHIPLPLIIAALVGFAIGAGGEIYTQVVVEERYELDVKMILFEGAFNAVVAVTGAWGASIGAAAARQAGKLTMRMVVNTVAKEAALGALEGASHSILRQFAEGKNMNQVNMGRVWSETVSGGLSGAFGGIIGVGADVMKQARTAVSGNVAKNAKVLTNAYDSRGLLSDYLGKPVNKQNGKFYSILNESGGQVFVSTENIIQSDIADIVASTTDNINIISGRHGDWMDNIRLEPNFYIKDVERFGKLKNVKVFDFGEIDVNQISGLINSKDTTILGWCYSEYSSFMRSMFK